MWKLFAFAAAGVVLLPLTALAQGGAEVVAKGRLHPDAPIVIEGEEFAPNNLVRFALQRPGMQPVALGEVEAVTQAEAIANDRPAAETAGLAITTGFLALAALLVLWRSRVTPSTGGEEMPVSRPEARTRRDDDDASGGP